MLVDVNRILAEALYESFRRAPVITSVGFVITAVTIGFSIYSFDKEVRQRQEAELLKNQDYAVRIEELQKTKESLESLLRFVGQQQKTLRATESTIASLKAEQEKIKPLVDADKRVIDALFEAQEARNSQAQSRERWIGFGLGVGASLIASVIYALISYAIQRKKSGRESEYAENIRP